MRAILISSFPFLGVLAGSLFGQSVTLTVSGEGAPQVSSNAIVLQSPEYTFDVKCQGGPWKFQISGSPDFSPSPVLRPDQWWDCPETLHVHLAVSTQPAEMSIASASAENTSGRTALVKISWAQVPASARKASSWETVAIILSVFGFVAGVTLIILASLFWRKVADDDARRTKEVRRNAEDIAGLTARITQLEALAQRETVSPEAVRFQIDQLRREFESRPHLMDDVSGRVVPRSSAELPPGEITPRYEVSSISAAPRAVRDDSAGGQTRAAALTLLTAVEGWWSQSANLPAEPPGQLAGKIKELREVAEGSKELSEVAGLRDRAGEWRNLAFYIACLVADHTDEHIDPRREDPRWQALLQRVFDSAGIEEILPMRNDSVNDLEHHSVGSVPRQSANDLPCHIAHVRQRGFRMGGRLIRKAAVAAYD